VTTRRDGPSPSPPPPSDSVLNLARQCRHRVQRATPAVNGPGTESATQALSGPPGRPPARRRDDRIMTRIASAGDALGVHPSAVTVTVREFDSEGRRGSSTKLKTRHGPGRRPATRTVFSRQHAGHATSPGVRPGSFRQVDGVWPSECFRVLTSLFTQTLLASGFAYSGRGNSGKA
jgi:hypothetical protein